MSAVERVSIFAITPFWSVETDLSTDLYSLDTFVCLYLQSTIEIEQAKTINNTDDHSDDFSFFVEIDYSIHFWLYLSYRTDDNTIST